MPENKRKHKSNLSACSPDCPVIILAVPVDTCPDQHSAGPPPPAQHPDFPQSHTRNLRIQIIPEQKTHQRASRAPTPLVPDWPNPLPTLCSCILTLPAVSTTQGTTLEKINLCWEKEKRFPVAQHVGLSVKGKVKPLRIVPQQQQHCISVVFTHFITLKQKMKANDEAWNSKGLP